MANSATPAFSYSRSARRRAAVFANTQGLPPNITGTFGAGNTLTMNPGTWAPATATLTEYQWFRGHDEIVGATAATYVMTTSDLSQQLHCAIAVTDPNYGVLLYVANGPVGS